MYLFTHKYIRMIVGKNIIEFESGIKKHKDSVMKSREKI